MKLAITMFTVALSSQALADCAMEQSSQASQGANNVDTAEQAPVQSAAQRHQLALDCMMRPAPFVQEPLVIELDDIKNEFVEEADPYPEARKAVAANS